MPCVHSVGVPLEDENKDSVWPYNQKTSVQHIFQKRKEIWSLDPATREIYLQEEMFALRIASASEGARLA